MRTMRGLPPRRYHPESVFRLTRRTRSKAKVNGHIYLLCSTILILAWHFPSTHAFNGVTTSGQCGISTSRIHHERRAFCTGITTSQTAPIDDMHRNFKGTLLSLRLRSLKQPKSNGRRYSSSTISYDEKSLEEQSINKQIKINSSDVVSFPSTVAAGIPHIPSYRTIFQFVGTTVLILLSEPLLSLVDTTVVGQTSPSYHLAALGPSTMLIDSSLYLLYFLAIATTNRLATAIAQDDPEEQRSIISSALGLATIVGSALGITLWGIGRPLLYWILGGSGANYTPDQSGMNDVLTSSLMYVRIRSLVAPISVISMVAQAGCLASLDTKTPFVAVMVASAVNIFGDVLLCKYLKFGIIGAAVATAVASVASCAVLMKATKSRFTELREMGAVGASTSTCQEIPFVSLPGKSSFLQFLKLAGPVFLVILGKVICYDVMTLRANKFGIGVVAAHSVLMRVFNFFATFGDSISQAAQTFMPGIIYRDKVGEGDVTEREINGASALRNDEKTIIEQQSSMSQTSKVNGICIKASSSGERTASQNDHRKKALRILLSKIAVVSLLVSVINSQIASYIIRTRTSAFTTDDVISKLMSKNYLWIGLSLALHPFIMLCEGSIIASRDLKFLVATYLGTIGLMFLQLQWCKSFTGVWRAFFLFQTIRLVQFSSRIWKRFFFG